MSDLNAVGFASWTNRLAATQSLGVPTGQTQPTGSTTAATQAAPAASVDISQGAQLVSKLQQLQNQDPAQFTQTVTQIAQQLQSASQSAGNGTQAGQFLASLANRLAAASGSTGLSSDTGTNTLSGTDSKRSVRVTHDPAGNPSLRKTNDPAGNPDIRKTNDPAGDPTTVGVPIGVTPVITSGPGGAGHAANIPNGKAGVGSPEDPLSFAPANTNSNTLVAQAGAGSSDTVAESGSLSSSATATNPVLSAAPVGVGTLDPRALFSSGPFGNEALIQQTLQSIYATVSNALAG